MNESTCRYMRSSCELSVQEGQSLKGPGVQGAACDTCAGARSSGYLFLSPLCLASWVTNLWASRDAHGTLRACNMDLEMPQVIPTLSVCVCLCL